MTNSKYILQNMVMDISKCNFLYDSFKRLNDILVVSLV